MSDHVPAPAGVEPLPAAVGAQALPAPAGAEALAGHLVSGAPQDDIALRAEGLRVVFDRPYPLLDRLRGRPRAQLHAVDGVDLDMRRGESLALVGESGSGKSTLARALTGLAPVRAGRVLLDGRELPAHRSRSDARRMQMVFQDPYSSLNPRLTVGAVLTELLRVHGMGDRADRERVVRDLLGTVGLGPSAWDAYPRQFSGGQRQRVAIARALVLRPDVLIADEPVSALDVSVQATILNLLGELARSLNLTMLFVAHNLAVVRHLCDRVAVMYLGRIVEIAPTEQVFADPRHPYTQGLLRAIPRLSPARRTPQHRGPGRPTQPLRGSGRLPVPPPGARWPPTCAGPRTRCWRRGPVR